MLAMFFSTKEPHDICGAFIDTSILIYFAYTLLYVILFGFLL